MGIARYRCMVFGSLQRPLPMQLVLRDQNKCILYFRVGGALSTTLPHPKPEQYGTLENTYQRAQNSHKPCGLTHKGRTFIHKLKLAIDGILNANVREEQRVGMPNVAAPPAIISIEIPIQQIMKGPPIMKTWDPTAKRNLINSKCAHQQQRHNNTPGDVPAITQVPPTIIPTDVGMPHGKQQLTCVLTQMHIPHGRIHSHPSNNPFIPRSWRNKSKCMLNQPASPQYVDNGKGT
jgi:hypothetical protein